MIRIFMALVYTLVVSCRGNHEYVKYVYSKPQILFPFEAVSEVDIWFSRLSYRGLTKVTDKGIVKMDLAESIKTNDFKEFHIKLKNSERTSFNNPIDVNYVHRSLEHLSLTLPDNPLVQNIKSIQIKDNEIILRLRTKDTNLKDVLATHLFLIHNPEDVAEATGKYVRQGNFFRLVANDREYPKKITPKLWTGRIESRITAFDTALLPPGRIKKESGKSRSYSLFETWGLVLNLKDAFKNKADRKCLSQAIERKKFLETLSGKHLAVVDLKGSPQQNSVVKKCSLSERVVLGVPVELGEEASSICNFFESTLADIRCQKTRFNKLLEKIKSDEFDATFLALTMDYPFLRSFNLLLMRDSSFRVINTDVEIPKSLLTSNGNTYVKELSDFISSEEYFIAMSRPKRVFRASKIDGYNPSMINPGYDSLENLKR